MRSRSGEVEPHEIREPAVAGQFYPDDAEELRSEVGRLLALAPHTRHRQSQTAGEVLGGIAPHAGYMYSGEVAARFYLLLSKVEATVAVIIAPSHREYFDAISVFCGTAYRTPLGDVRVNREMAGAVLGRGEPFINSWLGHHTEHALEVQLPFLQTVLPTIEIVPIVMGDQRADFCMELGAALADLLKDRRALIIASSDLSHYHTHEQAMKLDRRVRICVKKLAPDRLLDDLESGRAEACGGGPIVATMIAAERLGAASGEILDYRDSSYVSGDEEQVVGYLAAAFCKA